MHGQQNITKYFKLLLHRVHILHEIAFCAIMHSSTTALETFTCTALQFKFRTVSLYSLKPLEI